MLVDRLAAEPGSSVKFGRVLLLHEGDTIEVGAPGVDGFEIEAKVLAHKLAAKPPVAIRQAKAAINTGIDLDLENGCRFENEAFALTFATADKVEGMTAFLQKRAANFKGE